MIRPESRWWLLTLAAVGVLVAISMLALDRSDVVWLGGKPFCPHCRSAVPFYGSRCPSCDQQYDWTASPDAASPLSPYSLSALEAEHLRVRIQSLGEAEAAQRVSVALSFPVEAARRYLAAVGRGRCGWCGGTGLSLDEFEQDPKRSCPVCFGRKWCIACGGDRRIRLGDPSAARALADYAASLGDVAVSLPLDEQHAEARRLNEAFILRHTGTLEATYLVFWPEWRAGTWPVLEDPPFFWGRGPEATRAVAAARRRLDHVLVALTGD